MPNTFNMFARDLQMINIPWKVTNQEVFWETIQTEKGIKLQKNFITGHARILNKNGIRVAWGNFDEMESSFDWFVRPWKGCKIGDVLAVQRFNGMYSHYAIYVGYGKVIHYAQIAGEEPWGRCCIHKADFSEFIKTETCYEIIHFPEDGLNPTHECIDVFAKDGKHSKFKMLALMPEVKAELRNLSGYHLYSAKETVERAKSRLGEDKYNLAFNNCEHFALWCKTGIKESSQVDDLWKRILFGGNRALQIDNNALRHPAMA